MVELSDCDSEKWTTILEWIRANPAASPRPRRSDAADDYELVERIRQVQLRLTADEVAAVIERFRSGESMASLAQDYGCARGTISGHLKKAGLRARDTTCPDELVERMIALYQEGLSLERVGRRVGVSGSTVRNYLRARSVPVRDAHGRGPSAD